jgi:hypothetical protein
MRSCFSHPLVSATGVMLALASALVAQTVNIALDVTADRVPVSPYLYGKNDSVGHPNSPLGEAGFQLFREAGVGMLRMNGGNNGTKYNWQKRLTSHPDWYNNVYASAEWDYSQARLQQQHPGVQAMWCFQRRGKVAEGTYPTSTTEATTGASGGPSFPKIQGRGCGSAQPRPGAVHRNARLEVDGY